MFCTLFALNHRAQTQQFSSKPSFLESRPQDTTTRSFFCFHHPHAACSQAQRICTSSAVTCLPSSLPYTVLSSSRQKEHVVSTSGCTRNCALLQTFNNEKNPDFFFFRCLKFSCSARGGRFISVTERRPPGIRNSSLCAWDTFRYNAGANRSTEVSDSTQ